MADSARQQRKTVSSITSFRDIPYKSEEMKGLLSLDNPEVVTAKEVNEIKYNASQIFPDWILGDGEWKKTTGKNTDNTLSDILKTPPHQRTQEQVSTLIHWLMGVWEIANTMGFKRCGMMLQAFKYFEYAPGENIIVEGERGLTFYIIISGETQVHKGGIGVVAQLGQGKSFGEIALTQGKDLRTATIRALSRVEVLQLHKLDYDTFVKDIQLSERRENFHLLRECPLFKEWARAKVERMSNACNRMVFNAGQSIFKQGDEPDNLYLVFEGSVRIIKNVHIVNKNRWPTGPHDWAETSKRITKPFLIQTLTKGGYFGELSIMKQMTRSTTAEAATRCTLIALDKLEFLHLLNHSKPIDVSQELLMDAEQDNVLLQQQMEVIKGGPSSVAMMMHTTGAAADGTPGGTITRQTKRKPARTKTVKAKGVCTALLELQKEHVRHVKVAEDRLKKLAQDKLFEKNPHLAAASAKQAAKEAAAAAGPARPTSGILSTMVMSGNFGNAETSAVANTPKPPGSSPDAGGRAGPATDGRRDDAEGAPSTTKAKAKLLNTHVFDLKDRIDIILCSATPPPNAPLVKSRHFHHFGEEEVLGPGGRRSRGHSSGKWGDTSNCSSSSSRRVGFEDENLEERLEVPQDIAVPTGESTASDLQVLVPDEGAIISSNSNSSDDGNGNDDSEARTVTLHRQRTQSNASRSGRSVSSSTAATPSAAGTIPLPELRDLWRNVSHSKPERRLTFNTYDKPEPNPLRIKPLMYNVEHANYYHTSSVVQLPSEDAEKRASSPNAGNHRPFQDMYGSEYPDQAPLASPAYQCANAQSATPKSPYGRSFNFAGTSEEVGGEVGMRGVTIMAEKGRANSRIFGKSDEDMNVALQKMKEETERTRRESAKGTSFIISTKSPLDHPSELSASAARQKHRKRMQIKGNQADERGARPVHEDEASAESADTGGTSTTCTPAYDGSMDGAEPRNFPTGASEAELSGGELIESKLHFIDLETQKHPLESQGSGHDDSEHVSVDQDLYDENAATALAVMRLNNPGGYDYNSTHGTEFSGGVYSSAYSGANASLSGGILGTFTGSKEKPRSNSSGVAARLSASKTGRRGERTTEGGGKLSISKLRENLASKGKFSYRQVMGL